MRSRKKKPPTRREDSTMIILNRRSASNDRNPLSPTGDRPTSCDRILCWVLFSVGTYILMNDIQCVQLTVKSHSLLYGVWGPPSCLCLEVDQSTHGSKRHIQDVKCLLSPVFKTMYIASYRHRTLMYNNLCVTLM